MHLTPCGRLSRAPVLKLIEHRHLLALGQQFSHKMGADEAGTTRH